MLSPSIVSSAPAPMVTVVAAAPPEISMVPVLVEVENPEPLPGCNTAVPAISTVPLFTKRSGIFAAFVRTPLFMVNLPPSAVSNCASVSPEADG